MVVSAENTKLHHDTPKLLTTFLREKCISASLPTDARHKNTKDPGELSSKLIQIYRQIFTTGVDYAGPILLRVGKTRNETISNFTVL